MMGRILLALLSPTALFFRPPASLLLSDLFGDFSSPRLPNGWFCFSLDFFKPNPHRFRSLFHPRLRAHRPHPPPPPRVLRFVRLPDRRPSDRSVYRRPSLHSSYPWSSWGPRPHSTARWHCYLVRSPRILLGAWELLAFWVLKLSRFHSGSLARPALFGGSSTVHSLFTAHLKIKKWGFLSFCCPSFYPSSFLSLWSPCFSKPVFALSAFFFLNHCRDYFIYIVFLLREIYLIEYLAFYYIE